MNTLTRQEMQGLAFEPQQPEIEQLDLVRRPQEGQPLRVPLLERRQQAGVYADGGRSCRRIVARAVRYGPTGRLQFC